MKPTPQQQKTIQAPCGNILVSAAAGSGKTTVMTQRIVRHIVSDDLDIRNVLVMTFTDAAARSMKAKIEKELRKELGQAQDIIAKKRLYRQILLLNQSNISTIHAFCLEVIKNFYYEAINEKGELPIEPGFRIEDPEEAEILLSRSIDTALEQAYEQCDDAPTEAFAEAFLYLTDAFGSFKSDQPLRTLLRSFYLFLRSMPDYMKWTNESLVALQSSAVDINRSGWFEAIRYGLSLRLQNALEGVSEMRRYLDMPVKLFNNTRKNLETVKKYKEWIECLDRMQELVKDTETTWDDFYGFFLTLPELPKISKRAGASAEKAAVIELTRKHFAELIFYTTGDFGTKIYQEYFLLNTGYVFYGPEKQIKTELTQMLPAIEQLIRMVGETDRIYTELKRESNIIDFGDFEHLALLILKNPQVQKYYSEKFQEIYIDEYQDTSSIQESILTQITGNNCFMVGDVKQSIYKFRHAKPKIFMGKYLNFQKEKKEAVDPTGTVFELNTNFRSTDQILDAVNNVFYQVMSLGAGEIEYDHQQALFGKDTVEETKGLPVQILLTDIAEPVESTGEEELTKYEIEAQTMALEIRKLLHEGHYTPGDISILSRTRNQCNIYAEALKQMEIPCEYEQESAFLDRYELKVLEALLHVCDNPMQDIPLVSVMLSPILEDRFTEEELLEIRINGKNQKYFHECVRLYAESGENEQLKNKILSFYNRIQGWREALAYRSISEWISEICSVTGLSVYTASVTAQSGSVRAIEDYIDWVRSVELQRKLDLHTFTELMREIREKAPNKTPFGIEESRADSVKVMTLHKSKGLEYPVVFLAGSNRRISSGATKDDFLFSEETGIGFLYINVEEQYKYPTPLVFAMKEEMKRSDTAEEMRLLYVGMTRAMERLYITGVYDSTKNSEGKGMAETFERVRQYSSETKLPPHVVLGAKTCFDWILMAIARNPYVDTHVLGIQPYPETNSGVQNANGFYNPVWQISARERPHEDDLETNLSKEQGLGIDSLQTVIDSYRQTPVEEDLVEAIIHKYFSEYPYPDATTVPLKISVSEIKRKEQEEGIVRGINTTMHSLDDSSDGPLSGAAIGIAVHSVFRYSGPGKPGACPDRKKVEKYLQDMVQFNMIGQAEHQVLSELVPELIAYFSSNLYHEINQKAQSNHSSYYKEMPFTLKLEAQSVFDKEGFALGDFVLVQGIIDCWYEEDGEAILVDYKTDRLNGSDEQVLKELKRRYQTQMSTYAQAIHRIKGFPVKKSIIWLVRAMKAYEIPIGQINQSNIKGGRL